MTIASRRRQSATFAAAGLLVLALTVRLEARDLRGGDRVVPEPGQVAAKHPRHGAPRSMSFAQALPLR
jgi:hypothetical protein